MREPNKTREGLWRRVQQHNQSACGGEILVASGGLQHERQTVMSKKLLVSRGQIDAVWQMAREKAITREDFQVAQDKKGPGGVGYFLDSLRYGGMNPPFSSRLHFLPGIKVCLDQPWLEAAEAAGPYTPRSELARISKHYPPTEKGEMTSDYVAVSFYERNYMKTALEWGNGQKLQTVSCREVFAVAKRHRTLNKTLGQSWLFLVDTTPCDVGDRDSHEKVCCVWWDDTRRGVSLDYAYSFGDRTTWFLFRKPSALAA